MSDSRNSGPEPIDINKYRNKEPQKTNQQLQRQEPPKRELSKEEQLRNKQEDERFAQRARPSGVALEHYGSLCQRPEAGADSGQ